MKCKKILRICKWRECAERLTLWCMVYDMVHEMVHGMVTGMVHGMKMYHDSDN